MCSELNLLACKCKFNLRSSYCY